MNKAFFLFPLILLACQPKATEKEKFALSEAVTWKCAGCWYTLTKPARDNLAPRPSGNTFV